MRESPVVVLTSADKPVESILASSVNYPHFPLDNVPNYGIKQQLDLLEVASSDFRDPKNRFRARKRICFTSPGDVQ